MFYETAQEFHGNLSNFSPYAPASNRDAWNCLDGEWKSKTIHLGEQYMGFSYAPLSATDFMEFLRTGNRTRYEDKFFGKRHALDALILAECVENRGRFTDDIINGIFSICEESAWQLPAHNSYIRDTPQLPLPDITKPVLDLFACETGAILGTAYYLLKDKLDAVSPFITKRILHELNNRIFLPYTREHFWWMGNGKEPMNNWTIWCTQNVLLSVFLTGCCCPELQTQVFRKACQSTDYFLAEYGEDGCCDEGAQYYRHAGLCLFNVIEILNGITYNHFSSLYQEPKIQNIASYILNVHINDKYYVNFADCSPVAGRAGVREFLFAERICNNNMMNFAARDFVAGETDSLLLPEENNLYYRLQNGFTVKKILEYNHLHSEPVAHQDIYYPSVGIFCARDESLYLAVKAGDNADSHNHNDTGSFIIYKNGKPFLIDVGVESYTKKTFSPQRYEIWTMQSSYHNLPTINGISQKDGEIYRAKDISYQINDILCEISMDISAAYPKASGLSCYRRKVSLLKGKEILIHDTFSFLAAGTAKPDEPDKNTIVLNLMSYHKPIPQYCLKGVFIKIDNLGLILSEHAELMDIQEIPITDQRLKTAWEHNIYRILLHIPGNENLLRIS